MSFFYGGQINEENILSRENTLKLFNTLDGKKGVYIITFKEEAKKYAGNYGNSKQKMLVKIGLASNLKKRLDNYFLYWPEGFQIFFVFTCRTMLQTRTLEKNIHRYLLFKSKHISGRHSHLEEWFELSYDEIFKLVFFIQINKDTLIINSTLKRSNPYPTLVFPYNECIKVNKFIFFNIRDETKKRKAFTEEEHAQLLEPIDIQKRIETDRKKKKKGEHKESRSERAKKKLKLGLEL